MRPVDKSMSDNLDLPVKSSQCFVDLLLGSLRSCGRFREVRNRLFFVKVMRIIQRLDVGNEWWNHHVQFVPLDITEPLVALDLLSIVGIDISTSIISVVTRKQSVIQFVSFRTDSLILVLNYTADEILTPSAYYRLAGKCEGLPVIL